MVVCFSDDTKDFSLRAQISDKGTSCQREAGLTKTCSDCNLQDILLVKKTECPAQDSSLWLKSKVKNIISQISNKLGGFRVKRLMLTQRSSRARPLSLQPQTQAHTNYFTFLQAPLVLLYKYKYNIHISIIYLFTKCFFVAFAFKMCWNTSFHSAFEHQPKLAKNRAKKNDNFSHFAKHKLIKKKKTFCCNPPPFDQKLMFFNSDFFNQKH